MTQRSFSNPSQHAWNVALQDIQAGQKADEVYNKVSKSRHNLSMLLRTCVASRGRDIVHVNNMVASGSGGVTLHVYKVVLSHRCALLLSSIPAC